MVKLNLWNVTRSSLLATDPEHEIARLGGLQINPITRGPVIDENFHSSVKGVFCGGQSLRGVETADHCAVEGKTGSSVYSKVYKIRISKWQMNCLI
ncbi:MAG: hypothetical protein U0V02_06055 [Anaerolineales bacterium]